MKFSMYMASANRLGIPHEMMTVISLGRRSSAPLHNKNLFTSYELLAVNAFRYDCSTFLVSSCLARMKEFIFRVEVPIWQDSVSSKRQDENEDLQL
jgi:hypothetical protein